MNNAPKLDDRFTGQITTLDQGEILAVSGGGDGEDLATVSAGLATIGSGMALIPILAPAAPVVLAAAATTLTIAFVAEAFES